LKDWGKFWYGFYDELIQDIDNSKLETKMLDKLNLKMKSKVLTIVAKQNNKNIYLIEYKHKEGVGFVVDLEKNIRTDDDNVQEIRKKGFWIDIRCSENVAKRILEKIEKLKTIED
jgi:hypothetical protein